MGSCGVRTIKDDDGSSYELALRDCGDHYEGVPQKVTFKHKSGTLMILEKGLRQGSDDFTSAISAISAIAATHGIPSSYVPPRVNRPIHLTVTGQGWVFKLPKLEPPIDEDEDEYNKNMCETNRETLKKFVAAANREHLRAINSYVEQNNSEVIQRYFTFLRDCKKKLQLLEEGADREQIIADLRGAYTVFLYSCLMPYYDRECDYGSHAEDVFTEVYGSIPDTVAEIRERVKARIREALY